MRCEETTAEYCDCSAALSAVSFARSLFALSSDRLSCSTATFTNTTPASRIPLTTIQRIPPRARACVLLRVRVRGRGCGRRTGSTVTAWACERLANLGAHSQPRGLRARVAGDLGG